jgi:plastocyanin
MRIRAAAAVLAATAVVAVVGVAGAAEEQRAPASIYAVDDGLCFATQAKPACDPGEAPTLTIQTGETVTWDFAGTVQVHNVASSNYAPNDPGWRKGPPPTYATPLPSNGTFSRRFDAPGTYEFVCQAHAPGMRGTIVVEGEGTVTPTATPTASPTSTPLPTVQPDDHTTTPAPTGGAKDVLAPRLGAVRASAQRRAVRVRFELSEPATVVITARRSRAVIASATVQAAAGARGYTLRSSRLTKGRYTIEARATDAVGNRSPAAISALKVKR